MKVIDLDPFCFPVFDDNEYCGSKICDMSKHQFITKLNEIVYKNNCPFIDGYAPFCKHIFLKNFTNALPNCIVINHDLEKFIQTDYKARTIKELPVLSRWISLDSLKSKNIPINPATYLDIILYSKEQLKKESDAMAVPYNDQACVLPINSGYDYDYSDCEYSVISIKAQNVNYELPMKPITIMRNSMISEGGSGVPINHIKYMESVNFWKSHCDIQ